MPLTLSFTLDPLRSWRMCEAQAKKGQGGGYLEQALTTDAEPVARAASPRRERGSRVDVRGGAAARSPSPPESPVEQIAVAARLRQDVLFLGHRGLEPSEEER